MQNVRKFLDGLYLACGVIASLFLIAILTIIVSQMLARWTGQVFPGATNYAGYCMAAASFFAFAHALNRGSHIRVSLLLNSLSPKPKRWLDTWCFAIGTALAWYFVYYAQKATVISYRFGDVSQGQDATPIWIPQLAMVIGSFVFAIALTDHLVHLITKGEHRIKSDNLGGGHA